jgi:tellurite methyltransferase
MAQDPGARERWNATYGQVTDAEPRLCTVLAEFGHLLPSRGTALDLACGLGGNALWLAGRGLETRAFDISDVVVARLQALADERALPLRAEARDLESDPLPSAEFDVIVVSRFLLRSLASALMDALKPGGLLFFQTFVQDKDPSIGPSNPDFLLGPNELLEMFRPLRLVVYREEGTLGDVSAGFRSEAILIGQKVRA